MTNYLKYNGLEISKLFDTFLQKKWKSLKDRNFLEMLININIFHPQILLFRPTRITLFPSSPFWRKQKNERSAWGWPSNRQGVRWRCQP